MMEKILKVNTPNDYALYVGAEVLHDDICVVHYDELEQCRHALCNYGVYGIFLLEESPYTISYGQGQYRFCSGSLLCVAPGQMGGVSDNGEIIHIRGWVLMFSPQLLAGTPLEGHIDDFHFFSYYESEALRMLPDEQRTLAMCMKMIRHELQTHAHDQRLKSIVVTYLQLILEYSARFYDRQFQTEAQSQTNDLLIRFDALLKRYYDQQLYRQHGLPSVRYCAQELFLSPNYFGDLIRQMTGDNASSAIRRFVMQRAQQLLAVGHTVAETAEMLGFDYPQHFTRTFKRHFGLSPSEYQKKL